MADITLPEASKFSRPRPLVIWVLVYGLVTTAMLMLLNLPAASDYVGADNDDVMRLVQVRDLLAGQSWFDLTQYRLGLDGGTLMHWSRLIDLPIALLISLFSPILPLEQAEALALLVWPLLLTLPLLAAMAVAARRMGDDVAMHIALMLTSVFVVTSNRFLPGSIDHHNVQLVLVATIAAGLLDPSRGASGHALAGLAAAMAIAIGAETTPLIAVACATVGILWAVEGPAYARAARAFSLTLLISLSALFFATVPPAQYDVVTCDSLSLGFYAVVGIGSAALFIATQLPGMQDVRLRVLAIAVTGVLVGIGAVTIAPQCLQNPLDELDPLLQSLWLSGVVEAQSVLAQAEKDPSAFGAFYAVGFFAICVCLFRIVNADRPRAHAIILALVGVCFAIALVQVRGAIFANLLAIPPLALLIAELRRKARNAPDQLGIGLLFALTAFLSVPSAWALFGVLAVEGTAGVTNRMKFMAGGSAATSSEGGPTCEAPAGFAALAGLPKGTVAAASDFGPEILRFTHHRTLSGPYHRNQGGMLTEIHIGLAEPEEAAAFLRGSGVDYLVFCPTFAQTQVMAAMKTDGLYAQLLAGKVPGYLRPVPIGGPSGLQIYRVELP
ncbi:hypothetical protein [Peteryoungia algae]|uniref:Oligosaccharyl transferase-like protein n=1 Tax=Peteryoungia algae TaxID=2919917 RepID=A0ABT0CVL8_9HYPH|nr:hypothetical protein [Rhizobium sp. SSM4.3]MCJ8236984.1 hypothetical protein [Rhizobium sp. SSM4.3]